MKKKLIKYSLVALTAFLPLPFIFEYSLIFGSIYILVAVMICGGAWRFINSGELGDVK